jgi:hypothetical protein
MSAILGPLTCITDSCEFAAAFIGASDIHMSGFSARAIAVCMVRARARSDVGRNFILGVGLLRVGSRWCG